MTRVAVEETEGSCRPSVGGKEVSDQTSDGTTGGRGPPQDEEGPRSVPVTGNLGYRRR